MGLFVNITIFVIALLLVSIAGAECIISAIAIDKNPAAHTNGDLENAHKMLTIASVLCWVTIALLIVGIALYLYFGSESIKTTGSKIVAALMIGMLLLLFFIGILAILGATSMKKSSAFTGKGEDQKAYNAAIIAASLGVGGIAVIVIVALVHFYEKHKAKAKKEAVTEKQSQIDSLSAKINGLKNSLGSNMNLNALSKMQI